ncbi:MAG: DNA polymerase III subunit delta' [bacterium]
MLNWQIIGHKNILNFFENSLNNGKIANSYLFYGPQNVGKTAVALQFIKILSCINKTKPCEECINCKQIENGIFPDLIKIKREEEKSDISIDQVREMRERLFKGSFLNFYKIGLIKNAEYLNEGGWNSLLKIMEEPMKKMVIILIANKTDGIPATILSRCQKIRFSFLPEKEIYEHIIEKGIHRSEALKIARFSQGRVGIAKKIIDDSTFYKKYNDGIKEYLSLFNKNEKLKRKNELAAKMVGERENNGRLFDVFLLLLRDLMLAKTNLDLIINLEFKEELLKISEDFSLEKLNSLMEILLEFKKYLASNVNPKFLMENFILEM